jgi:hypothetical protein
MKNGKCPMCGSSEVYSNPDAEFSAGGSFVELTDIDNELMAELIPYVFLGCGFAALFATDVEDLKGIS